MGSKRNIKEEGSGGEKSIGEQGKDKDRGKVMEMRRDEEEEVLKEEGGMGRGMEGNQGEGK